MTAGLLVTADEEVFVGRSVGAPGVATGELVFNTSMAGYQEVVTDPSYTGQVVAMTAPHIGNYGTSASDAQAERTHVEALVTRSLSRTASNWRSTEAFSDYLTRHGVVVLSEVDTRRLTRHVRDRGAMPVAVGSDVDEGELRQLARETPPLAGRDLVSVVTTRRAYEVLPRGEVVARVIAYDFGIKGDIIHAFTSRGVAVTVVPAATAATDVLAAAPDGVFLSNGPGDPEPLTQPTAAVASLLGMVPLLGICLGHQVLGRALGARTFKLKFGHHGGNHPVRRVDDGRVEITSQNHGFAVDLWSLSEREPPEPGRLVAPGQLPEAVESPFGTVTVTHQNLNDGTLEGLACLEAQASSVQYHPEAAPGPNDAAVLFDRFVAEIGRTR